MLDELIHNEYFRRWFPPLAALGLMALTASLGMWQLDRAAEKNRVRAMFEGDAPYTRISGDMPVTDYQNLESRGQYLVVRQVLIDNIVLDGRPGMYVMTPFRYAPSEPLLIVNRGWMPKAATDGASPDISLDGGSRTIRGRVGHLPRVGIRSRDAFDQAGGWPRHAVYPTLGELAREFDEKLLPFVLLLDPQQDDGFVRRWQPREAGPMMHYGYAIQWFAMSAAALGFVAWRLRKKRP